MGVETVIGDEGGGWFAELTIAAFSTRVHDGFIPHAKHGARGVRSSAECGSKFDGTGFENEQIGHIQVAMLVGEGSDAGKRNGLSVRDNGVAVALLEGGFRVATVRF